MEVDVSMREASAEDRLRRATAVAQKKISAEKTRRRNLRVVTLESCMPVAEQEAAPGGMVVQEQEGEFHEGLMEDEWKVGQVGVVMSEGLDVHSAATQAQDQDCSLT